jgi:homoserine dehydrogenase
MFPPATPPPPQEPLRIITDVASAFYLHMEVADQPGVLGQIAAELGAQGASIKSVVQRGLGEHARLTMVIHPLLESRLFAALQRISTLEPLRARPRAIRVIEEEFV